MAFITAIRDSIRSIVHSGSPVKTQEGLSAKVVSEIRTAGERIKPLKEDIYGPKVMYDDLERSMFEKPAV